MDFFVNFGRRDVTKCRMDGLVSVMPMESTMKKYFAERFLPCTSRMYAAALAILGSQSDAEDAVQTAMLKIWENIRRGNIPDSPEAYALTAVRRICLNELSRLQRLTALDAGNLHNLPSGSNAGEEQIALGEVTELMRSLPATERRAIELTAYGGCSSDELAAALGTSSANARQILSRGRKKLRSLFSR